jgi:hypothetical protein
MFIFHIAPIKTLRDGYWLALYNAYRLIEILLKECVKFVVSGLSSMKSQILLRLLPQHLCLSLIADLLPPSRI